MILCLGLSLALAQPAGEVPTPAPSAPASASGNNLDDLAERRDPFKRPDLSPKFDRSVTELETFSTLEYRMVGVVSGARTRAMLLGPNGKTYFVKEGDKIGIQKGSIIKITPEKVAVRERVSNLLGKEEMAMTEIRLPTESGVSVVTPTESGRTDVEYQQTVESIKRSNVKKSAATSAETPAAPIPAASDEKKALDETKSFFPQAPDANINKKGD